MKHVHILLIISVLTSGLISSTATRAKETSSENTAPATTDLIKERLGKTTIGDIPAISNSYDTDLNSNVKGSLPSMSWKQGQTGSSMPLALADQVFGVGKIELSEISPKTKFIDSALLKDINFKELEKILGSNTALKELGGIDQVALDKVCGSTGKCSLESKLQDIVQAGLGDKRVTEYLPNIDTTMKMQTVKLNQIMTDKLSQLKVSEIGNLTKIPLSQMPNLSGAALNNAGPQYQPSRLVFLANKESLKSEKDLSRIASGSVGSDKEPNAACKEAACSYVELKTAKGDGAVFIDQKVRGGTGGLGALTEYLGEPAGADTSYININGCGSSISFNNVDGVKGTANMQLNAAVCNMFGRTPYFIPIPLGQVSEKAASSILPAIIQTGSSKIGSQQEKALYPTPQEDKLKAEKMSETSAPISEAGSRSLVEASRDRLLPYAKNEVLPINDQEIRQKFVERPDYGGYNGSQVLSAIDNNQEVPKEVLDYFMTKEQRQDLLKKQVKDLQTLAMDTQGGTIQQRMSKMAFAGTAVKSNPYSIGLQQDSNQFAQANN
jgi:hypothetical protein